MKRIRDVRIYKAIERALNKKIEYVMESDFDDIDSLDIISVVGEVITPLKDRNDLWIFEYLKAGVKIRFEGIDLNHVDLVFTNTPIYVEFEKCRINGTKVICRNEKYIETLIISQCEFEVLDLANNFPEVKNLTIESRESAKVDQKYTLEEIATRVSKIHPEYNQVDAEEKIKLMREEGYIRVFPDDVEINGIQELERLSQFKLEKINIKEEDVFEILDNRKYMTYEKMIFKKCRIEDTKQKVICKTNLLELDSVYDTTKDVLKYFTKVCELNIANIKQEINLKALKKPRKVLQLNIDSAVIDANSLKKYSKVSELTIANTELSNDKFLSCMKKLQHLELHNVKFNEKVMLEKIKNSGKVQIVED